MKLSLFSIIGGTFYKFNDVPITTETLMSFENEVSKVVTDKLHDARIYGIKITPELVASEEHNGDVMVKDIFVEHEAAEAAILRMVWDSQTRAAAIDLINKERDRQDAKWGEQNHPPHFWTGILGEEYGEYCQAVNETVFNNGEEARKLGGYDNMMTELTHVAAVAIGAMESLMRAEARKEEGK